MIPSPRSKRQRSKSTTKKRSDLPKIRFQFEDFERKTFNPKALITELTSSVIANTDNNNNNNVHEVDATGKAEALSAAFQEGSRQLQKLQGKVNKRINYLIKGSQQAEEAHKKSLQVLNDYMKSIFSRFRVLDQRIATVAHTAVRIGHTLQVVDEQKKLNVKAQFLIDYYLRFSQGKLPKMFNNIGSLMGSKELFQAAEMIQMLHGISLQVRIKENHVANEAIIQTMHQIEEELLNRFDTAAKNKDAEAMKACATTLLNFRGGAVITRYVTLATQQLNKYLKSVTERWDEKEREPTGRREGKKITFAKFKKHILSKFFKAVLATVRRECETISIVFSDNPMTVFKAVLEEIFHNKLGTFLKCCVDPEDHVWTENEYLQVLHQTHLETRELVVAISRLITTLPVNSSEVAVINLDEFVSSTFQTYTQRYKEQEFDLCSELIHQHIEEVVYLDQKQEENLRDMDFFGRRRKGADHSLALKEWLNTIISADLVQKILDQTGISIERCIELVPKDNLAEQVKEIYLMALTKTSELYFDVILSQAEELLPDDPQDPKEACDYCFLPILAGLNAKANKFRAYYREKIGPILSINNNTQTICESRSWDIMSALERRALSGLTATLNASISWINKLFSKQKSSEYRSNDENTLLTGTKCTATCETVTNLIAEQYENVINSLEGKNLDTYLTVFGTKLYRALKAHLMTLKISTIGAALLANDIKLYQRSVRVFHMSSVNELFTQLRSLVNVFFVTAENVEGLLTDQTLRLGKLPVDTLHQFLKLRSDYDANRQLIMKQLGLL